MMQLIEAAIVGVVVGVIIGNDRLRNKVRRIVDWFDDTIRHDGGKGKK